MKTSRRIYVFSNNIQFDERSIPASDICILLQQEIFERLNKTHTVSSANTGQIRHPKDPPKPPGYGMKMFPIIEGLDTRFAGFPASQDKVAEVVGHLMKTQTTASQAKLDNPRILLYPERTTLMNNVERIRAYQENGAVAKQNMLQRREKWYN